jgi:hypothetical protein
MIFKICPMYINNYTVGENSPNLVTPAPSVLAMEKSVADEIQLCPVSRRPILPPTYTLPKKDIDKGQKNYLTI